MSAGRVLVYGDLGRVREALLAEGFRDTVLQIYRKGQVFGLVKPLNETLEVHVRAYRDGSLDAEVEVSRKYIEHLTAGSEPAVEILTGVLRKHGIPYRVVRPPAGGTLTALSPGRLTPWKPFAAAALMLVVLPLLVRCWKNDASEV